MACLLECGYAFTKIDTQERLVATGLVNQFSTSGDHDGWYIGGGLEYAFAQNWIAGIEYQHVFWNSVDHLSTVAEAHRRIGADSDIVRGRISYHFGAPSPVVAKY